MKRITTVKAMLLALLLVSAQSMFAQKENNDKPKEKFRLKLVEKENGKETVIDKTFASREEMDAYMKENHKDLPEIEDVPEVPPVPPVAPVPGEKCSKDKHGMKQCKKVVILEDEIGDKEGGEIKIISDEFSPKERAELEKEIESAKSGEVKVIIIKKGNGDEKMKKRSSKTEVEVVAPEEREVTEAEEPGVPGGVEEWSPNISGIKLYPNPNNGQFHVEFKLEKPGDVKLRISDINGKEVYSETLKAFSGQFTKDIQRSQGAGTYILDVEAGGEKQSARVVVQ